MNGRDDEFSFSYEVRERFEPTTIVDNWESESFVRMVFYSLRGNTSTRYCWENCWNERNDAVLMRDSIAVWLWACERSFVRARDRKIGRERQREGDRCNGETMSRSISVDFGIVDGAIR